jgi:hypothetical protein
MALEVIDVLEPFLSFAMTFNVVVVHNMCALQLKGLKCCSASWNYM